MKNMVFIPIRADLYDEVIIRNGKGTDVAGMVGNVFEDFLDRTKDDSDIWPEEYMAKREEERSLDDQDQSLGDPQKGYYWQNVFLPNGTHLTMVYKNRTYSARVVKQEVIYDGKTYTPSELARAIANNTSRNAWRDMRVKRPRDEKWVLADDLRRQVVQ